LHNLLVRLRKGRLLKKEAGASRRRKWRATNGRSLEARPLFQPITVVSGHDSRFAAERLADVHREGAKLAKSRLGELRGFAVGQVAAA
jgi:hypothetical protein